MCRGQEQGTFERRPSAGTQVQGAERVEGGRKHKLPRCAKHKRRHGLRGESASYSYQEPIMAEAEKVHFGADEGYFPAPSDVEDYTAKDAGLQAGMIHVERGKETESTIVGRRQPATSTPPLRLSWQAGSWK